MTKSDVQKVIRSTALAAICLFVTTLPVGAQEGRPVLPEGLSLTAPLIANDRLLGDVSVQGGAAGDVLVAVDRLATLLGSIILPELLEPFLPDGRGDGLISLGALRQAGIAVTFDPAELAIVADLTLEQTQRQQLRLVDRPDLEALEQLEAPEPVSAYLNALSSVAYRNRDSNGDDGRDPARVEFDGALRLGGAVVEGLARYVEDDPGRNWQRDDVRAVYDDLGRFFRVSAGDLNYRVRGDQAFQPAAGFSIGRSFSDLRPFANARPVGRSSFTLRRPATVALDVNGVQRRVLDLQPGRYDLEDLALSAGLNDVVIRIIDDVGREEVIDFSSFIDTRLLAEGLSEFNYAIGLESEDDDGERSYDADRPIASAFHRYGFSDQFNAGLGFQADKDVRMGSADVLLANPLGLFGIETSLSEIDGADFGASVSAGYEYRVTGPTGLVDQTIEFSFDYRSSSFTPIGLTDPSNNIAWRALGRYSFPLAWDIRATLGASAGYRRDENEHVFGLQGSLAKRFQNGWTLNLSGFVDDDPTIDDTFGLLASASYIFGADQRQRISARHDTRASLTRTEWTRTRGREVGSIGANVGVQRQSDDVDAFGGLSYTANRFEASVDHDLLFDTDDGAFDRQVQRTQLRFGTALVLAGSQVALSRPVIDSFAILKSHETLDQGDLLVNASDRGWIAQTDLLGPAVYPDLDSYLSERLRVAATDVPLGYDIGPGEYELFPRFRSGYVFEIGSAAAVTVVGTLLTEPGEALSLAVGTATSLSDPELPPIQFFTNRSGRFALQNATPGRYQLRLDGISAPIAEIEIPDGTVGILRVGEIIIGTEG